MGRKGKRRRRKPGGRPTERGAPAPVAEEQAPAEAEPKQRATREERPRPRGLFGGGLPSPYPPLGPTLLAGLRPVAGSASILVVGFLFALVFWTFFSALGAEPSPRIMVVFTALPPVSTFFDAILTSSLVQGALPALGVVVGATLVRAVVLGGLAILTHRKVAGEPGPGFSPRGLVRIAASLFAILAAEVGLVLAVPIIIQGFLGPQVGVLAAWILGLYFLAMAPIIVVVERVNAAEGLRRSLRAARLPGFRHTSLVMLYFVFVLWVTSVTPQGQVPPATPTLVTWLITLGATWVHLGVLGAFTYRWLSVRDQVPAGPAKRRERER